MGSESRFDAGRSHFDCFEGSVGQVTTPTLGRVISDEDSPNHIRLRFQLRINNDVEAGQFVTINGNRQFLCQITKPWTFNPAFADPRLIQFHERGGPDVKTLYPHEEWTTAEAL